MGERQSFLGGRGLMGVSGGGGGGSEGEGSEEFRSGFEAGSLGRSMGERGSSSLGLCLSDLGADLGLFRSGLSLRLPPLAEIVESLGRWEVC